MLEERQDIEQLLLDGNTIQIKPRGYSMYPILVPDRDEAVIEPVDIEKLKRGDVVLYRRDPQVTNGILVLHRIVKCTEQGFYMVGDNQTKIEGPLRKDQIKGKMIGIVKNGKYLSVCNFWYRFLTMGWLWLRPLRPVISNVAARIKNIKK